MRIAGVSQTQSSAPVFPLGLPDTEGALPPGTLGLYSRGSAAATAFAEIKEVWMLSDHKVVHTATHITSEGGPLVSEPAWPDGLVVCHSMDKRVELLVNIHLNGKRSRKVKLVGRGSGLEFEKRIRLEPGRNQFKVTSSEKLPKRVHKLDVELYWHFDPSTDVLLIPMPVIFTMYVTAGEPQSDTPEGVTTKRLGYAVKWVAAAKSLDPFSIIKFIVDARFSDFDLTTERKPWELALQNSKADCRSLVKHVLAVVNMVGLSDTAKDVELQAVKLWEHPFNIALDTVPRNPNARRFKWLPDKTNFISMETPADEKKDLNFPELYHPTEALTRVLLFDKHDRPNAFQACLRYDDKSRTVYFPGGVKKIFEASFTGAAHREQVLKHVFKSLAWAEPEDPTKLSSWQLKPGMDPIKSYA